MLLVEHPAVNVPGRILCELYVAWRLVRVARAEDVEHCRAGFPRRHSAAVRGLHRLARRRVLMEPLGLAVPIGQRLDDRAGLGGAVQSQPGLVGYESDLFRFHGWGVAQLERTTILAHKHRTSKPHGSALRRGIRYGH